MKHVEIDEDGREVPMVAQTAVEAQIEGFLLGKVLTIIDASYGEIAQKEAIKSLIKEKFHSQMDWLLDRQLASAGTEYEQSKS